jgi:tRNA(fMet)-specific endonuclease VapC
MNDEFDILIGATVIKNNLTLVTDNVKHFVNMNGIKVENWLNR